MSDSSLIEKTGIEKTREQEILETLGAFVDRSIDAMSPDELRLFEQRSEAIMEMAKSRSSGFASVPGKELSSPEVPSR